MYIERPDFLFKNCIIKPFDDVEGIIIEVRYDRCGASVLVRYVMYGTLRMEWFYDFDIELKRPTEKGIVTFKDLE